MRRNVDGLLAMDREERREARIRFLCIVAGFLAAVVFPLALAVVVAVGRGW